MSALFPRLLTPYEVADMLHLPAARVVRLARAGTLPHIKLPNGELLFPASDLARWIEGLKGATKDSKDGD